MRGADDADDHRRRGVAVMLAVHVVHHRARRLAILGLPIALSMICASIFYLLIAGSDLGIAAEQILNGSSTATCCSRCRCSSSPPTS